ncbi:NADP-dependent oxidoreductase [Frankia sp. AgB1.9]|nr:MULTISPECIES: NADP-dependent oxidoreductase [unclassified Frankia]MBL7491875.1 NADP-dependent oxidoreductase [Frankia sp. AgW1.1]MBL7551969.1 NADP-dependent oxidoreductase [Frankia sp. AgB1.9]MBL7623261.1 NADP-dependent oxidoreductase [Frankia sp. AgB1.8]
MRAISQDELGAPDVLREVEIDRPAPGPSEVLVRVHAAGLNPTDWKHRQTPGFLGRLPLVLGWDVSGVVEALGVGVTIHEVGDELFGMLPYPHGHGACAEYVTSPARALVRKPTELDHVEAAAVPLAALTAHQALVEVASVQPGQRVLIHAAAGGVGHFAVQIAKWLGAHVIGTASAPKHDLLRTLGADELIDYRDVDFEEAAGKVDAVVDAVGGEYTARSLRTLVPGGILVSLALSDTRPMPEEAAQLGVRHRLMLVEADQTGMLAVADLVRSGALRPVVEATFPLEQAAKAHRLGDTGRVTGKVVLTVR